MKDKIISIALTFICFALINPLVSAQSYLAGPAGGTGGNDFETRLRSNEWVCGMFVRHAKRIDAIQLKVCDSYGNSYKSQRFGGKGGSESFFAINKDEYLAGATIFLTYKNGNQRVAGLTLSKLKRNATSLLSSVDQTFGTQTKQYVYVEEDRKFYLTNLQLEFVLPGIRGIWGRAGSELDALGFIFSQDQVNIDRPHQLGNITRIAAGGLLGSRDEVFYSKNKICEIKIRHAQRIDALQFSACQQGRVVETSKLFGSNGGSQSTFSLAEDEYIKEIKGSTIKRDKKVIFSSIYFVTNKRTSPTFGVPTSAKFNLSVPSGKEVTGIFANYDDELYSIELILE